MSVSHRVLSILVAVPACLALGCTAPPGSSDEPPGEQPPAEERVERFVPLFDGETFAGWEGDLELFRVEDGAVVAGNLSDEIPRNEFLCTTREYGNFEMRLQARISREDANGGIQFRSRRAPESSEVIGYQADIGLLGGDPPQNIWGALYDEARRRELLAVADQDELAKVFRPGDWNDYVIRAEGGRIGVWINGYQTTDYTETDADIELEGIICLQVHAGAPAEIRYRNLEIEPR
jgi:hypothetical protein